MTGEENGRRVRLKGEIMAWEVWKERCRILHKGDRLKPEVVIHATITLADETWTNRSSATGTFVNRRTDQHRREWTKPMGGTIKINCDATWMTTSKHRGTGVVARD